MSIVEPPTVNTRAGRPVRVLIVDDSAFARKVVREILSENPFVSVVGQARDGEDALEQVAALEPELVICDLKMPRLDGVGFVRRQMQLRPLPILILSAAAEDAAEVVDALEAGAVDVVRKPTALATEELRQVADGLISKIRHMLDAQASGRASAPAPASVPVMVPAPSKALRADVVVLGISTGGPQALRWLLPLLPADFPLPICIVLHMPFGYTALYAEKLNELCKLQVKEAEDGDMLRPGLVLLAKAGRHLLLRRTPHGSVVAHLSMQPIDKIHRPSVDVLFRCAAEIFGGRVLAVVMTGMGDDGREGAGWVKAQGGRVITEAESSCVIYGMPRSVVEAGLSDAAAPLDQMANAIIEQL